MKSIEFVNVTNNQIDARYHPKPAKNFLADWYKQTPSRVNNLPRKIVDSRSPATVKKCVPVFDYLTAGYVIPTHCDIYVERSGQDQIFHFPEGDVIGWHPAVQVEKHPMTRNSPVPKIISPWAIKTPRNYSCLFVPPGHMGNIYFNTLEGYVDTDTYLGPVNYLFTMRDKNFEGMIPAGTPIVQVIPVRREQWTHTVRHDPTYVSASQGLLKSVWFDGYKRFFWTKKRFN